VFNGHFQPTEAQKVKRIGNLRQGVIKVLEDEKYSPSLLRKYKVADMITGFGVAESVRHYYELWGGSIAGKRIIVQGWGNVGAAAAYYCAQFGAVVVGIIDRAGGIISEQGLGIEETRKLFLGREGTALKGENLLSFEEVNQRIWDTKADVFLPCAASRLLTEQQVRKMIDAGIEVVSCGANVPFADQQIFYGPIAEIADEHLSVIPDFIANCGMARVFAYLMSDGDVELTDEAIFEDTSRTIRRALESVRDRNRNKTGLSRTAFELALNKLL
ncbi:MAG: amino acid dehydrogenase, partial [Flavobacteriales bacterium]|nr:amino acid dehydrogenase [Flavobacteriales bacterium]